MSDAKKPGVPELTQENLITYVDWETLRPHMARDAIILVSPKLDLLEVGNNVARNDSAMVQGWISSGMLTKPTQQQLEQWEQHMDTPFQALIVQPYVLVQVKPEH